MVAHPSSCSQADGTKRMNDEKDYLDLLDSIEEFCMKCCLHEVAASALAGKAVVSTEFRVERNLMMHLREVNGGKIPSSAKKAG